MTFLSPIKRKIYVAQTRIIEFYNKMNGKVYISFSGGKDSTVLLHIARQIFPDIRAVFVDTGLEYPEVREHVKTFDNVTWLKPEKNFKRVVLEDGYPVWSKETSQRVEQYWRGVPSVKTVCERTKLSPTGGVNRYCVSKKVYDLFIKQQAPFKISSKCCDIMKKKPAKKFEKETGLHPVLGTMACESSLRETAWYTGGCNVFDSSRPLSKPLSIWTEQDILEYIAKYNIAIPEVYGQVKQDNNGLYYTTGVDRTGCQWCAYGKHLQQYPNDFERLMITHPAQWNFCMKPVEDGGLGMQAVLDYCGISSGNDPELVEERKKKAVKSARDKQRRLEKKRNNSEPVA